jgi:hypothetical protein
MEEDEDPAPTAAESLRLIQTERAATERSLRPDPRLIYLPWGIAYLVGFGLLYLRFGPDDKVTVNMPNWLPLTTLYSLMLVAFILSGVTGARAGRAVSGDSSVMGFRYGMTWLMGFAGMDVLLAKITNYLPGPQAGMVWAAASIGIVGTMYMAGGAVWRSRELFLLGTWIGLTNIAGVVAGPGWHSLIVAVTCGGGLIIAGALFSLPMRV